MRVLHVIGSLIHGGAEALLYRMATTPTGTEHIVASFGPPAHYSKLLSEEGVEVHHLGTVSPATGALATWRLLKLMKTLQPDVVQSWMYRANILAGACGRLLGIPVVWGVHCSSFGGMSKRALMWIYMSGPLAKWLPSRVVNCSARSAETHKSIGYDPSVVDVVFNGYDTTVFRPDSSCRQAIRKSLGLSDETFVIGNVSRWHPQKDHRTLLQALRVYKAQVPYGWKCLLVGRDLDHSNSLLMEEIRQAGVEEEVICLGPRADMSQIMRALDVHVLSSAFGEAFPNVVAEAMSSGTPSIVTDVGDSAFLVGDTGWVAPPRKPAALAGRVHKAHREWSQDPQSWRSRSLGARKRIVDCFTLARMIDAYEEIWKRASARKSGPKSNHTMAEGTSS